MYSSLNNPCTGIFVIIELYRANMVSSLINLQITFSGAGEAHILAKQICAAKVGEQYHRPTGVITCGGY